MDWKKLAFACLIVMAVGTGFYLVNNHNTNEAIKEKNIMEYLVSNTQGLKTENAEITKTCLNGKCWNVEIADNNVEREIGLMNRGNLSEDAGMLFIFDTIGKHGFWMKNTLIALDIIWIDENGHIVFIKKDARPCLTERCESYYSDENARYVLEVNSGIAERYGIKKGDNVELRKD